MNRLNQLPRQVLLAPIVVLQWLAATAFAPDVRLGIAAVAIGLGAVSIAVDPAFFKRMLTPSIAHVFLGLAAAVVMVVATYGLYPIIAHAIPYVALSTRHLYVDFARIPHPSILILLFAGLIVIGEEVLWRGVVQEAAQSVIKRWWAIPVSALIYGLSHALIGSPLLTVVAVICGVFWSFLRARSGSLLPALIAHLVWDITILTHPLITQ